MLSGDLRGFEGPLLRLKTDAKGYFRIPGLPPGTYTVRLRQDDESCTDVDVCDVAAGTEDLSVVLPRKLEVRGVVVDPDGKPVSRAFVAVAAAILNSRTAETYSRPRELASPTDDTGAFMIALRACRKYRFMAGRNPFVASEVTVDLRGGAQPPDLFPRIVLGAGASLKGVVVRKRDGAPMPGLAVERVRNRLGSPAVLWFEDRTGRGGGIKTQADGSFAMEGFIPGVWTIRVYSGEGARALLTTSDVSIIGGRANEVRIDIPETGSVRGKVIAAAGDSVPAAAVHIATEEEALRGSVGSRHGRADADGRFETTDLAAGRYVALAIWKDERSAGRPISRQASALSRSARARRRTSRSGKIRRTPATWPLPGLSSGRGVH